MYTATTRAIRVTVRPQYLPDQSDPAKSQYVWAYQVRIENKGDVAVQLRSRHWKITDGLGRQKEVKGPGVVGKTPRLRPGEVFEYTSGTPLSTPSGFMNRHLPDGERNWREFRHRDPDILARHAGRDATA
jgi:ApaG protein